MGAHVFVPPEQWFAALPRFFAAAGALIMDRNDHVLLVAPTYRNDWLLPGGGVEADETPIAACARETREELGVHIDVGRLLVADWVPPRGPRPCALMYFVFDGGVIDDPATLTPCREEIGDHAFLPLHVALSLAAPETAARLSVAIEAKKTGTTACLPAATGPPNSSARG